VKVIMPDILTVSSYDSEHAKNSSIKLRFALTICG